MSSASAVGIDLGTTSSSVAIMRCTPFIGFGDAEVLSNSDGDLITECCVGFTETNFIVGAVAKYSVIKTKNCIFDVKKLLGRPWDDPVLQKYIHHLPYDIINDKGEPKIRVEYKREICLFSPEEIISFIITKLMDSVHMRTQKHIRKVVITVPAHFQDNQRTALKKAATIAGLKVLDFLPEPIAAVMAYELNNADKKQIFVFDFGGARVSASVVLVQNGKCNIVASCTNIYVGGDDFDDRLFVELLKILKRKHNLDVSENQTARHRLRDECRKAKRFLSARTCEDIHIESLHQNTDFKYYLTRVRFELMNQDLFEAVSQIMRQVLEDANLSEGDIDDIVLAGRATRMPKVRQLLNELFKDKEFHDYIPLEEVMAKGAARHAAKLDKFEPHKPMFICAITESLGIETSGGLMDVFIPRLSVPPVKCSKTYTTFANSQPGMTIRVFQGNRALTGKNRLLTKLEFALPDAPKGFLQVEITFKIDRNDILTVTVEEKFLSFKESIKIEKYGLDLFLEEDRLRMLDDYEDEDKELRKDVTNTIEYLLPKKIVPSRKVINLG